MESATSPASQLAHVLAELGVSQGELTRRTGLSRTTVYMAYHGKPCSTDTWIAIARALKVPVARISPRAAQALDGIAVL